MPNCYEILNQIAARSGLDRTAGHPLYSYRVTPQELDLLRHDLSAIFKSRGSLRKAEECGAFCLFGAEWFRRNYRNGPWSWDVIFDALDLNGSRRPNTQVIVADYVKRGLQYWNVRLLSTQSMNLYLRTVVCQGGFPINTLRKDGAGLSRMLKACLRDHERFPSESMSEVLSRYIHLAPTTLQTVEVRQLAADLVEAIARLRKQSDEALSGDLTRVDFLDQTFPGWEVVLPLRVEDPEAKGILLSLLDAAKTEPVSRHALSVSTAILCDNSSAVIVRTLRCPNTISKEDFRRVCKMEATQEIPPRMTGYLQVGDQLIPAISITSSSDGLSFRLTKYENTIVSGSHAFLEASLVFAVGGEEVHRISLPGGEALPESPWVFAADDLHQLVGVGSTKVRDESVWIALPSDCEVHKSHGSDLVDLNMLIAGRKLVELTGEARFVFDDVQYRVCTRSDASRDCLFELRGVTKRLGLGGSQVWCGPPSVWQISLCEEASPKEVKREHVQWRSRKDRNWRQDWKDCLGEVQIRVQSEGETLFLDRVVVMPAGFQLQVLPSKKPTSGSIEWNGLGNAHLFVEHANNLEANVSRSGPKMNLTVDVVGLRPACISVRIHFENGNDCSLSVVCPTTSYSIIDVLGQPHEFPNGIPFEQLDGLTLQVIQPENKFPVIYWPEGPLFINKLRQTKIPGVYEFPLSYLSGYATELLACSDDPDGRVRFGIGMNIAFTPKFSFSISRYAKKVDRTKPLNKVNGNEPSTELCIHGITNSTGANEIECSLTVVPLGRPKDQMPSESVVQIGPGSWEVQHTNYPPGYYLALGADSLGSIYRPLRFVVKASEINKDIGSEDKSQPTYWHVMNMYDKHSRLRAWDDYVTKLVTDFAHPDWSYIDDFVDASESLPITTFEAVGAITRNHFAAARYGILYPNREILWRRFEQLPFLWSFIPVSAWIEAATELWKHSKLKLLENGFDEEQSDSFIDKMQILFVNEAPQQCMCMFPVIYWIANKFCLGSDVKDSLVNQLQKLQTDFQVLKREKIKMLRGCEALSQCPNFPIDCTDEEMQLLRYASVLIDYGSQNEWALLNGPAIAALKSLCGQGLKLPEAVEYKRLRALDPTWYDVAFAFAMISLLISSRVLDS